jgi:hypothetical protein
MSVPATIASGSTLLFTESIIGYPATLYTLAFILNLNGTVIANIAGTPTGNDFIVTSPAVTTALWQPGRYNFAEIVTKTSDSTVTQICSGQLSVTPNFAATITPTAAMNALAAAEAGILALMSSTNQSVNFAGQQFTSRNLKEFFDARDRLRAQVDAELRAMGVSTRGGGKNIVTQFTNG